MILFAVSVDKFEENYGIDLGALHENAKESGGKKSLLLGTCGQGGRLHAGPACVH